MKKIIIIISLITIFVSAHSAGYDGYTGCAEQDSLALVAFYWATDGPNWTSNQDGFSIGNLSDDVLVYHTTDYPYAGMGKWLEGPVKDWFGVLLENQQVGNATDSVWRVIHLRATISRRSAGDNNLKGFIPKEVGMLTALKWFKVNGNAGLSGTEIPDEMYHPTLEQIDVEGVFFGGIVSNAIRQCKRLNFINLRDNSFDSVPRFDFLDQDVFDAYYTNPLGVRLFLYRNQLSWSTIELTVDYILPLGGAYEARDQKNVGRAREVVVTPGSSVTLTSNDAGSQGTHTWHKKGFNTFVTGTEYTIPSASASDTGNYTVLVANEYIRLNDANATYANTFTKPIHVTFVPSAPVCKKIETSYNGQKIYLTFSKPMSAPILSQTSEFAVTANGGGINISGISRTGRLKDQLVLQLETPITEGQNVLVSYTKGSVADVNGGALNSFTDRVAENQVRTAPSFVDAITRVNGESIILTFDRFIDGENLNATGFNVEGSEGNSVAQVILRKGPLNDNISKEIELILNEPLFDTDTLSVSYTSGTISGLYGGSLPSFGPVAVTNVVEVSRSEVNLFVVDGTANLKNIIVKGEMKSLPFNLYDDGTHGDQVAGDHTWSVNLQLNNGTYEWAVYERTVTVTYDTVITVDGNGQITMTLTPIEVYADSLLSSDVSLNVTVKDGTVTGDTLFEYYNNILTFILEMTAYRDNHPETTIEPFLMGIKDDWAYGIKLDVLDSTGTKLTYTSVVSGFKMGEEVGFNFRNSNEWENSSPLTRIHTVQGNDTVISVFGNVSTTVDPASPSNVLRVYPNPVGEFLFVKLQVSGTISNIKVFNLYGQQLFSRSSEGENFAISTDTIPTGVYIIEATTENGEIYRNRFIKK